jgi:hypothetical protein
LIQNAGMKKGMYVSVEFIMMVALDVSTDWI